MVLQVRDAWVAYDGVAALRGVSVDVPQGAVVALLGPSGCGKTTLLRAVAGLEPLSRGTITLAGRSLAGVPVHQRGVGLMFQDYALFPHMSVAQNVRFGLRQARLPRAEQHARVAAMLAQVGLADKAARDVTTLSGGEQQRVALARSLAPAPRLLMLDEPLAALDAALREELQGVLADVLRRTGQSALYVTHDQREALALADTVVLMRAGRVVQVGAPQALYRRPETVFAAQFLGLANVVPVQNWPRPGQAVTPVGTFTLAAPPASGTHLLLHPDGLTLTQQGDADTLAGVVQARTFRGAWWQVVVRVNGTALTLNAPSFAGAPAAAGTPVGVRVLPGAAQPLADDDEALS